MAGTGGVRVLALILAPPVTVVTEAQALLAEEPPADGGPIGGLVVGGEDWIERGGDAGVAGVAGGETLRLR